MFHSIVLPIFSFNLSTLKVFVNLNLYFNGFWSSNYNESSKELRMCILRSSRLSANTKALTESYFIPSQGDYNVDYFANNKKSSVSDLKVQYAQWIGETESPWKEEIQNKVYDERKKKRTHIIENSPFSFVQIHRNRYHSLWWTQTVFRFFVFFLFIYI